MGCTIGSRGEIPGDRKPGKEMMMMMMMTMTIIIDI
jgi:hypothetical protein